MSCLELKFLFSVNLWSGQCSLSVREVLWCFFVAQPPSFFASFLNNFSCFPLFCLSVPNNLRIHTGLVILDSQRQRTTADCLCLSPVSPSRCERMITHSKTDLLHVHNTSTVHDQPRKHLIETFSKIHSHQKREKLCHFKCYFLSSYVSVCQPTDALNDP